MSLKPPLTLLLLFVGINMVFPDTITYWNIKRENAIKLSASIHGFDSTQEIGIAQEDLNKEFEVNYCVDTHYDAERKIVLIHQRRIVHTYYYKTDGNYRPMAFRLQDVSGLLLQKNDTLGIYYFERRKDNRDTSFNYIGRFVAKEHIKSSSTASHSCSSMLWAIIPICITGGLAWRYRRKRPK